MRVTLLPLAPVVSSHPKSVSAPLGQSVAFSVEGVYLPVCAFARMCSCTLCCVGLLSLVLFFCVVCVCVPFPADCVALHSVFHSVWHPQADFCVGEEWVADSWSHSIDSYTAIHHTR